MTALLKSGDMKALENPKNWKNKNNNLQLSE